MHILERFIIKLHHMFSYFKKNYGIFVTCQKKYAWYILLCVNCKVKKKYISMYARFIYFVVKPDLMKGSAQNGETND